MLVASHCIYLHGIPGSPEELLLFEGGRRAVRGGILAPNRTLNDGLLSMSDNLDALALAVANRRVGKPLTLIGFSLGSKIALELAVRLGDQVDHVHLISPAAPLQSGNYLPDMAGRAVFQLAARTRAIFRAMIFLQSLVCRVAPGLLFDGIFAKAAGGDRSVSAQPEFRAALVTILNANLSRGAANYRNEIIDYVQSWVPLLRLVEQPVTLWSGDADNWTPTAMTNAFETRLPNVRQVHRLPGLSHYSALEVALAKLDFR